MNISHDGVTVYFKTAPEELFLVEKSGTKPNTVRIIDTDEYEMLNMHPPKKIGIRYQEEIFIRTLTNLHFAKLFGHVIVIFSWAHEEPPHSAELSLDERFAAITISNGTLALLQSVAHGRTMNRVIKEIYEAYIEKKSTERRPYHD